MKKPVAICINKKIFNHSGSWSYAIATALEHSGIAYEFIDCYNYDVINNLKNYSALFWHYNNYVVTDLMEARNIMLCAAKLGLSIFPDHNTGWHFDDKIAEMYALQSVAAPIPVSWVFYLQDECLSWLEQEAQYPLVAKLRCGSGSNNVKLLRDKQEALKYANKMFSKGLQPAPSLLYKSFSKIQSTKDWQTFWNRFKRIPEFLRTRMSAKNMQIERGYCYFQEFIENDNYDIKVVVIGDKLSFLVRKTRVGDFRASGGGEIFYDSSYITKQIIDVAFAAADNLQLQCMGFDFVVDKKTGEGLIVEMCYGFDWEAIYSAGGYFDRAGVWHKQPLHIPGEIVKNILI